MKHLISFLPPDMHDRVYREPFLGAGWLFFALQPSRAILSDANPHLIQCYEFVRDSWAKVSENLEYHASHDSEDYYYNVRTSYNLAKYTAEQAARFIYLNKSCFNGIFRVNLRGEFNVPYGWKKRPSIPSSEQLKRAAAVLRRAELLAGPFEVSLRDAARNDFIYLDPPYPPLNGSTATFTHYTQNRFDHKDQYRLAQVVRDLDSKGCKLMVTNADNALIRRLYKGFQIYSLPVIRYVTCKSVKHKVRELVITNYRRDRLGATTFGRRSNDTARSARKYQ